MKGILLALDITIWGALLIMSLLGNAWAMKGLLILIVVQLYLLVYRCTNDHLKLHMLLMDYEYGHSTDSCCNRCN